ncbi:MAG: polysaccharide deacetylase family protein [Marmoricola sp.]
MRITTSVLTVIAAVAAVAWVAPSRPSQATVPAPVDCRQVKCVALTFDDGPGVATRQILRTLKKYDAKATFFVLGKQAEAHPGFVRREVREGHQVGNHSWSHTELTKVSAATARSEFDRTDALLKRLIGDAPRFVRPPYGSTNATVAQAAKRPMIMWNVDTIDWKTHNPASTLAEVKRSTKRGSIVLMHDVQPSTAQALPKVIEVLRKRGFHFVTLDELFRGQRLKDGVSYRAG